MATTKVFRTCIATRLFQRTLGDTDKMLLANNNVAEFCNHKRKWVDQFPGLTDSPDHSIPRMSIIHNDTPSMDMSFFVAKYLRVVGSILVNRSIS